MASEILRSSREYPVLTITGPRQSGKTTLCRRTFPDLPYVSLEDPEFQGLFILTGSQNFSLRQSISQSLAGRTGQILNIQNLADDAGMNVKTAQEWLSLLEASYIIFRLPPFYENIGKRLIKSPKLYFYDPGLAAYLIGNTEI